MATVEVVTASIKKAYSGIPEEKLEAAMGFLEGYVKVTPYFTGGDALEAFRATKNPEALKDWRNQWGSVISKGKREGLFKKIGKTPPTTRQSHTSSLCLWQSCKFIGDMPPTDITARNFLKGLKEKVLTPHLSIDDALWQAYVYGREQSM